MKNPTASEKLNKRIASLPTATLKEVAAGLLNKHTTEATIVFGRVLQELDKRIGTEAVDKFEAELYATA